MNGLAMLLTRRLNVPRGVALGTAAGAVLLLVLSGASGVGQVQTPPRAGDRWSIDDFSTGDANSLPDARWEFVNGRATGGISTGAARLEEHEGRKCLHLTGTVAPNSRGSLVQARRSLLAKRRPLDAQAYDGLRLTVKGNGENYAIHLRTKDTRFPGQRYQAQFPTTGQWQEIKLPFESFVSTVLGRPLDRAGLVSLAVVAAAKEGKADIYIDAIALYRERDMYRNLTPEEERVIVHKGTERPFNGKYNQHFETGVYTCRRCGAELFESSSKFRSDCGWPSFDDQIPGAVRQQPDPDGRRVEIICNNCGGHLGHVFRGEKLTPKDTRYCVNSISMDFLTPEQRAQRTADNTAANPQSAIHNPQSGPSPTPQPPAPERALFASGCFWGTEYHFQRVPGVISTTVGFTGGHVENPTYKQVRTGRTGHAETTEVLYDPSKVTYEQLARLFFETHDFTQLNRQGPDIGPQYRSAIFYLDGEQKQVAERLVRQLRRKGYKVKTEITPAGRFWPAEDYHQDYHNKKGDTPYCHLYRRIF